MKKSTLLLAAGICLGMTGFAQVPFLQDFEGTNPPAGFTLTNTDGVGFIFGNTAAVGDQYFAPPAHTTFAAVNDDANGSSAGSANGDDWLMTPSINNLPANTFLSFDYFFLGQPTSATTATLPAELFNLNISTDGGSTWTVLDAPTANTAAWVTNHYDLSSYAGMNVMIGFEYNDGDDWMYGLAVDNIALAVPPTNSMQYTTISPVAGSPASYVLAPNNITISGTVTNLGTNPITTYTVKYTDGSSTVSNTKTANIASYGSANFTFTTPYNTTLGAHNIKSWIEYTNDASHADDTLKTVLTGASFLPTHQLVIEEGTGTWCGWCPRGAVFMDSMQHVHPNTVSLIAVHDATSDPMRVAIYDAGMTGLPNFTGFPTITADRKDLYDPADIFTAYSDHNPDFGFADLGLSLQVSGSNTLLYVTTTTKPAVDLNGTYQLALVLTEDGVSGTATGYAQHNYYSSSSQNLPLVGAGHNWQTSANPIPANLMTFDHVARSIASTYKGKPGSLPTSMTAGTTYNYTFASVPLSTWNHANLKAILMLIDVNSGYILNSKSANLTTAGITKNSNNINNVNVFPNPASANFNVNIDLATSQKTTISLYNVMGQVVFTKAYDFNAGENLINISADQLASGMYTLSVATESGVHQTKISVVK